MAVVVEGRRVLDDVSPFEVARVVGLGPRPVPDVPGMVLVEGPPEELPRPEEHLADDWCTALAQLHAADRRRWQVVVDGEVVLDVVDARAAGLWSVGREAAVTAWRPVSATQVWDALTGLACAALR
jgi:hypothetical protein